MYKPEETSGSNSQERRNSVKRTSRAGEGRLSFLISTVGWVKKKASPHGKTC